MLFFEENRTFHVLGIFFNKITTCSDSIIKKQPRISPGLLSLQIKTLLLISRTSYQELFDNTIMIETNTYKKGTVAKALVK